MLPVSAFAVELPVGASAYDLSALGLPGVKAGRVSTGPNADGVISSGEYPVENALSFGSGISLVADNSNLDYTEEADKTVNSLPRITEVREELYISFDATTCYLALRATAPGNQILSTVYANNVGRCMVVSFSVGLSQSDELLEASSAWSGTYYFQDGACKGADGRVLILSAAGNSMPRKFGNIGPASDTAYTDETGFVWDGAGYASRAADSLTTEGESTVLVAECAVPLEEVLLSVPAEERDGVRAALQNASGTVHGSVSTKILTPSSLPGSGGVVSSAALVAGMGSSCVTGSSPLPSVVPLPLYWVGEIPTPLSQIPSSPGQETDPTEKQGSTSPDDSPALWVEVPGNSEPSSDLEGEGDRKEEDWRETGYLPDTFEYPAASNEIVEREEEPSSSSNLSAILGVIAAFILALTALFLMLAIRADERRAMLRMKEDAADVKREQEKRREAEKKRSVRKRKRR